MNPDYQNVALFTEFYTECVAGSKISDLVKNFISDVQKISQSRFKSSDPVLKIQLRFEKFGTGSKSWIRLKNSDIVQKYKSG